VRTNLPSSGKAKSDQPLVTFSAALDRYAASPNAASAEVVAVLDSHEQSLKRECAIPG
jgi:hypothetical protein